VRWESSLPPFPYNPSAPFSSLFVPTVDTARYGALLAACLDARHPALLVGESGTGKSAIVARQLEALCQRSRLQLLAAGGDGDTEDGSGDSGGSPGVASALLTCSAFTSSSTVQAMLLSKLSRRGGRCAVG
jgi:hypothetical protein